MAADRMVIAMYKNTIKSNLFDFADDESENKALDIAQEWQLMLETITEISDDPKERECAYFLLSRVNEAIKVILENRTKR